LFVTIHVCYPRNSSFLRTYLLLLAKSHAQYYT
jgi:hypothetical protein